MQLHLNRDLFADRFVVIEGDQVKRGAENCYYHGTLVSPGHEGAVVAVSTCNGKLDGIIKHGEKMLAVDSAKMDIYSVDSSSSFGLCGNSHEHDSTRLFSTPHAHFSSMAVAAPASVNYFVELFVVNDYKQCQNAKFASTAYCTQYTYDVVNQVGLIYAKLPSTVPVVRITLVGIENWTAQTQIAGVTESTSMNSYLNSFTSWAADRYGQPPYVSDAMHLMTGWSLQAPVVGLAWVDTICSVFSTAVVQDTTGSKVFTSETLAHELGHNLGASHDGYGNSCPSSGYVMAAIGSVSQGSVSTKTWSTCSVSYFNAEFQALGSDSSNCLLNYPYLALAGYGSAGYSTLCGNGVLDPGEQCDSGLAGGSDLCSGTCQFMPGVVCDEGECCTSSGQFKAAGLPCRQADHECDLVDVCSGSNATCGHDLHLPNGSPCLEAGWGSVCWEGECYRSDMQCFETWFQYSNDKKRMYVVCAFSCSTLYCAPYGLRANDSLTCFTMTDASNSVIKVYDHSPCDLGVCSSESCAAIPPIANCSCVHGQCNQLGTCTCSQGWYGVNCSTPITCHVDCAALNRYNCVDYLSGQVCGDCLPHYSVEEDAQNALCRLQSLLVNATEIFRNSSDIKVDFRDIGLLDYLFDNNRYTRWIAPVPSSGGPVWAEIHFNTSMLITTYELTSNPSLPAQDPQEWTLYGCASRNCSDQTWRSLDHRTGESFSSRHLTRQFRIQQLWNTSFYSFRLVVTQPADQIISLGELQLYMGGTPADQEQSSSRAMLILFIAMSVVIVVGLAILAALCWRQRN